MPAAKQILDRKGAILAVDVFGTGELSLDKPLRRQSRRTPAYTFGYNRTLLAERVHDILTAVAFAKNHEQGEDGPSRSVSRRPARGCCWRAACAATP